MKRNIISTVSILLLLCTMVLNVSALEEPNMRRTGSISITMSYEGRTVPGGTLTLYRVASVHEENGAGYSFQYTREFADCRVSLEDLSSPETAWALARYIARNNIAGTKMQIDQNGFVIFDDLNLGLYLLVQEDAAPGYEPVNPFLVSVPGMKYGNYIYNVDASPKLSLEREPTKPTQPPTRPPTQPSVPITPPNLPQTGLNRWPVPILAISGLFLVVSGLVVYTSGKKRPHES